MKVAETVKEHRADELSAMFNLMMDLKRTQRGKTSHLLSVSVVSFLLADRTAAGIIGYWHDTVVCHLSVCPCSCVLWLNDTSYSKCLNK